MILKASPSTISALITTDMTRIACLGWGSLIWDPRKLLVSPSWENDGPQVHVEFLRISDSREGRMTLVLDESAEPVTSLWAQMTTTDLSAARESLRARERVPKSNMTRDIDVWRRGDPSPPLIPNLSEWAEAKNPDAVVYTNLGRNFHLDGHLATADEVVDYLKTLEDSTREEARDYVRKAPTQVNTAYRRAIEAALGWTPLV
jgi:hypothetical protein